VRLFKLQPETQFLLLAAAVGAVGALGNQLFRAAIGFSSRVFQVRTVGLIEHEHWVVDKLVLVLVPVLGGLAIGLLARATRRSIGGYGMPDFLEAVNLQDAKLSLRNILLRTLGAAITLGSGGSAGVEGPVATLGGGIGAAAARTRRLVAEKLRLMVACGASAAIAAAYSAPIAGVFFAQEIVLAGNYEVQNFVRVVVASGTATVVARAIRGDQPFFEVEPFELASGQELLVYLLLGLLSGVLAAFFTRIFYGTQLVFERSSMPRNLRPAVGGLAVGLIALASPHVLGDGAEFMQEMLRMESFEGTLPILMLVVLIVGKVIATSATLGSGGAGGVFGPSLFLGATLGAAVGSVANHFFPEYVGLPGHYAVVGMGALLGGATRAPLTAIFLVFEMTGSASTAVLPTLIAVAAALYAARRLEEHSIDEKGLALRGIRLTAGREERALTSVRAGRAMRTDFERVPADLPAPRLQALIAGSRSNSFVVVDSEERMLGLLTLQDLRTLDMETARELGALAIAADFAERDVVTVFPDETLAEALARMDRHGFRQLPVVTRDDPRRVLGMLERRHVISAYQRALQDSPSAR
jgi:CIC family chloride channel protein